MSVQAFTLRVYGRVIERGRHTCRCTFLASWTCHVGPCVSLVTPLSVCSALTGFLRLFLPIALGPCLLLGTFSLADDTPQGGRERCIVPAVWMDQGPQEWPWVALGGGSGRSSGGSVRRSAHTDCARRGTQVLATGCSQRRNRRPATGASSALLLQTSNLGPSGSEPWWLWGQGWPLSAHPPFSVLPPPILWVPLLFFPAQGGSPLEVGQLCPVGWQP